jgi:hypothetical protein
LSDMFRPPGDDSGAALEGFMSSVRSIMMET